MIVSHKHRFIFVKTKKTAGTSIEVHLSRICGPDDVVTVVDPPVAGHEPRNFRGWFNPLPELALGDAHERRRSLRECLERRRFYNHMPAWKIRARVPDRVWRDYYRFCVDRNPWDKTISHFHMVNSRTGAGMTFEQYLERGRLCLNHPLYTDPATGELLVDRVLRFEDLDRELGEVFARLGVPFEGSLDVRAKGDRRADRRPYQEVYTDEQRHLVERAFQREIALHGYSF